AQGTGTMSLHARLLTSATVVLFAFFGLTGLALNNAFYASTETAFKEALQSHIYTLLAAAELDEKNNLQLPDELPAPQLSLPGSGLYAMVVDDKNKTIWRSRSTLGTKLKPQIELLEVPTIGERNYKFSRDMLVLAFTTSWETDTSQNTYTFYVAESLQPFKKQIQEFQNDLWFWLGGAAIFLLAVQGSILRWSLSPLRQVTRDLTDIEAGRVKNLAGDYPVELRGLTNNLNQLIASAQANLLRYRNSLGDVAHSLKTPLAVLRAAIENKNDHDKLPEIAQEQVNRMANIVDYQLQRAATSGRTTLTTPVNLLEKTHQIINALQKVHQEKRVNTEININKNEIFTGDEGDLLEILGNLLENAFKWCQSEIIIQSVSSNKKLRELIIEDDGPGISKESASEIFNRGHRADETIEGQGLGLSLVQDIVKAYDGSISVEKSTLGGAKIRIRFI
ncbi:MAG: ATP-binding protein, partial [Acidiferrobacterales bacterium]